ncbi:tyrosine-type recombinase/integrase [Actinoallomurus purpureus]|uniref:tyrosine-type recombinase/integrase n=1 Tax=Actinoallomurus purpureus TaxID=478114 RepID=UPI00209352E8|nr:tyrosine-type recombinase/integrase [Actinoallomurus purpureus]MCO6010552.1 tyrosine-type recombinase/integrase [Actinoallomurus purpureus]
MKSTDVKFWDVRRNKSSKTASYEIRWVVAGKQRSRTRRTKALAESFLSDLRQAAKAGEAFDVETGLPESMLPKESAVTWYDLVRSYIKAKWSPAAGETRKSTLDALATVTPALVTDKKGAPDAKLLRRALLHHALNPPRWELPVPNDEAAALKWLQSRSLPVVALAEADVTRSALNAIAVTMDGRPAAATTIARKRAVLYNVLKYAVKERKLLDANPIDQVDWKAPDKVEQVDRSVVANPVQARQLLAAVTYVGRFNGRGRRLRALYACMYYGGLRPSEAAGLRRQDCELPELCACDGDCSCGRLKAAWGRLVLARSRPGPGRLYTDSGKTHDDKGLKRRPVGEKRVVPIPPELVRILREHLDEFGAAEDGRLFRTSTGGTVSASAVWRIWQDARTIGLSPEQQVTPLAGRPYDLRHACATLLLNAGVPPEEVARRLGHSVEVLWKVYAGCLDGDEERINRMIEKALAA